MKISLITPAAKASRTGNRTTAARWAGILRRLGHRVHIAVDYGDEAADLMVALHAWRSATSIARFHERHPQRPLIVALTGTDIYRFIHQDPEPTLRALDLAHALVGLHALVPAAIPARHHDKLTIIYQSAPPVRRLPPRRDGFEVLVVANLREEKDPLRTAAAARLLPAHSRIRVTHLGGAHDASWAERARAEMAENPRYVWRGEVPGSVVRKAYARAGLLVLSSVMEGGANVISEAVVAGVPVIASNIAGSVGLLGENYPGYYPVGDQAALAQAMQRAEEEPAFLDALRDECAARAALFTPERERESWRDLLARFK
jgi:putative glycosyltransferase (TIGR04348 family)